MEVEHTDDGKKGAFYIEIDGTREALMTYKHSGVDQITIDHTEVNDSLEGKGVGHKLINAAVEYLRQNKMKAIPQCPFVKAVFDKKGEELADVNASF